MSKLVFLIFLGILLTISLTIPALPAEMQCGKRSEFISELERKYDEVPRFLGITQAGDIIEIFTAPKGLTWTLVVTVPDGVSCLIGAGSDWTEIPAKRGSPS